MRILLLMVFVGAFSAAADEVNGYERKDGTEVQGYERTHENSTKDDNWSTRGNVNPNTGKDGTKPDDASGQSSHRGHHAK